MPPVKWQFVLEPRKSKDQVIGGNCYDLSILHSTDNYRTAVSTVVGWLVAHTVS